MGNMKLHALDPLLHPQPQDMLHQESNFVENFYKLITQSIEPPFAISIDGLWGTGKTTVMKMLQNELDKDGYSTFWFNPWKYRQTESVVLAFLQCLAAKHKDILEELKKTGGKLFKVLLLSGISAGLKIYTKGNISLKDVKEAFQEIEDRQQSYKNYQDSVTAIEEEFAELINTISKRHERNFRLTDQSLAKIQNEGILIEDTLFKLQQLKDQKYATEEEFITALKPVRNIPDISFILKHTERDEKPVVIFFDDLDRCLPEDAIQLLEALKNLFVTPKCRSIFVCGIDNRVAKQFIRKHYSDIEETFAINYFRKIFNLTVSMPTSSKLYELLLKYTKELFVWPDLQVEALADMVYTRGVQVEMSSVRKYLNVVNTRCSKFLCKYFPCIICGGMRTFLSSNIYHQEEGRC
jgi:predicted KAP-like P-loop ATPase